MNPYLAKLKETKTKMDALLDKARSENRVFTEDETTQFDNLQKEFDGFTAMAEKWESAHAAGNSLNEPDPDDPPPRVQFTDKRTGPFKNLVDQLASVKNFATTGNIDERLKKVNSALGMSEGAAADGGWAVQSDFAGMLIDTAVKEDPLLNLVDSYSVSANSNSVTWIDIDEPDIESVVFGGVKVYWAAEAAQVGATKPLLKEKGLKLERLMGLAYATYELNADSNFVDQLYNRAFQTAIRRELASCIIGGSGVGKPLGIKNSPALVTVDKETSQGADTINWNNISKMYHRALDKARNVWVLHPDAHEQLDFLEFPVGTGGVPVYLPATQQGTIDMLRGRMIIESDHCSALGDTGDILFIDPKEYVLIYKGGVQTDVSIHVQFLTAENAFRFIFRANGMPKRSADLKIKNSSKKRSPYIALAARA
jgi:HK97 family phage major capsid protein